MRLNLISACILPAWPLADNHLVAVLRTFGTRFASTLALRVPTPDGHRMFV